MTALTVVPPPGEPRLGGLPDDLPPELIATEPIEATGLRRDAVRLLVAHRDTGQLVHTRFARLPEHLRAGDVLVINTSATLPAAVPAAGGRLVHLSTELPGGLWVVELRRSAGSGSRPFLDAEVGEAVRMAGGASAELLAPFPADARPGQQRLWISRLELPLGLHAYLAEHGRPIRYGDAAGSWPLSAYQTVFALQAGSAEMPSAARGFTPELVTDLVAHGVELVPIVLHTGVSSQEAGEPPYPERFSVSTASAARINAARHDGRRVITVGTTATRAVETAADEHGTVHPAAGWTERVITPADGVRVTDGLITGWHEPTASHLLLLEAVAGRATVEASYAAAVADGYRWHEFGDLHLVL
ncbi:S-adenosylmethionine:tRNA ribosyltransferase-isomerase [soil metagenome]